MRLQSQSLLVPMALIGVCLVGTTPASAAFISFSEDPNDTAPIAVTTDIPNATITTGPETASLFVGSAGMFRVLLFREFLREPPGDNPFLTSDELELTQFNGLAGQPVGFQADFFSDFEGNLGGFGGTALKFGGDLTVPA